MSGIGTGILAMLAIVCTIIGLHLRFDTAATGSGTLLFGVAALLLTIAAYEKQQ